MDRRSFIAASGATVLTGVTALSPASAQEAFPSRPIRLVVPFAPGGTTDVFARLFAPHFAKALGATVVVENRSGANGLLGTEEVRRSEPDGYTLIFQSPSAGVTGPLTRRTLPFDPVADFSHVAILGTTPLVLAASVQSGIGSLRDLVAKARSAPQGLSYGTGGAGGGGHLAAELFRSRAGGFSATHVPYRGAGPALQDLMSGQIAYMADTFVPLLPLHKDGRVRIVSVFGSERAAIAPDVPTATEEEFDVVARIANYLSAPSPVPKERLARLAEAAKYAMTQESVVERLKTLAYVPVSDSNPVHATQFIAAEVALWRPVIQAAGLVLE